jgi:hypothetical protein
MRPEWQLEKFVRDNTECQDGIMTPLLKWISWLVVIVMAASSLWRFLIVSSATA